MNLHNEIMNIPAMVPTEALVDGKSFAYKIGHRDARHAAAELSLKAEARIEELELLLAQARAMVNGATDEWHNKVAEILRSK
jgi:hypothetical protein